LDSLGDWDFWSGVRSDEGCEGGCSGEGIVCEGPEELYVGGGDVFCEEEDRIELGRAEGSEEVEMKFPTEKRVQKQKRRIGMNGCPVELEALKMVPRLGRMRYGYASPRMIGALIRSMRRFLPEPNNTPAPPNPASISTSSATCSSSHSSITQSTCNGFAVHIHKISCSGGSGE
jgi:hypothetical protein